MKPDCISIDYEVDPKWIKEKLNGRLDALVNNAGISPKGSKSERLNSIDTDLKTWGHVFHVNFFVCKSTIIVYY